MFDNIKLEDDIMPRAKQFILDNDRSLYTPFVNLVRTEAASQSHEIFLGGAKGRAALCRRDESLDEAASVFEYFTLNNPFHTARKIADKMYAEIKHKFIDMRLIEVRTAIRNKEVSILVNTLVLFTFTRLPLPRVKTAELVNDFTKNGLIGPLLQSIDVLQALYTPRKCADWPALARDLETLLAQLRNVSGAAEECVKCVEEESEFICEFEESSLIFGGHDNVKPKLPEHALLIGDYTAESVSRGARFAFISSEQPESVARFYGPKCKIIHHELFLTGDWRIKKYTIYDSNTNPIADMYNSTSYELIAKTGKLPSALVLARFTLIDALMARTIGALVGRDNSGRINSLYARVFALRDKFECPKPDGDFAGVFVEESVAKKRLIDLERVPSYFPAKE